MTEDMIVRVRDAELAGKYRKTRDLFVFMCYTGLSYVDMQGLRREDVVERGDTLYIKSHREKTGEVYYTPVLPAAREVLERYEYRLPSISNQKMNKYLHDIERMLDIPVPMTCHVARHSFATLMLSKDVPIPVVAKMLGHASTKTTEIYAKVLQNNVEEKSVMVIDKLQ
jgi:integrase